MVLRRPKGERERCRQAFQLTFSKVVRRFPAQFLPETLSEPLYQDLK